MRDSLLARLDEVASLATEKATASKDPNRAYVGLEHLPSGGSKLLGFAEAGQSISTNNVFREGDVLFGKLRPRLRKSIRAPFAGYCSTDILVLRPTSSVDPVFAAFVLQSDPVFGEAIRTEEGTKMPRCSWSTLRKLRVYCPPTPAQQRIAEILATVDEAIEQTEALIAKTQQIKAGLMHDLFTRGVTADGQLKPASRTARTEFGLLPDGWTAGSLLDVADEKRQPILTGPFGADLGNDDFVDDGVPVLRIGNVQAGYLDLSDLLFVTPRKAQELVRYVIRSGDLLFARQGATTGRNALASDDVDGCLINYHIIRVALDHEKCAPLFIEAAFNGEMVKRQVERDKGRGTREGINTAQLKALRVPLAPVEEQRKIAEMLAAQNEDIQALILERDKLRRLKHGLMHDLLTGSVPVEVEAAPEPKEVAANV